MEQMQKRSLLILFVFNCVLVGVGWILALYSYPRLPQRMPLWLPLFGLPEIIMEKSLLFFLYPFIQTFFVVSFIIVARMIAARERQLWKKNLLMDYVLLNLVFFNLIFIHTQSSLVLLAHRIREGINSYYFYALFLIVIILIPYYRLRSKILKR